MTTTIPASHPLNGNSLKHVNRELVFIASYVYHVRAIVDCRLPNMQDKLIALSAMLGCILTAPGVPILIKLKFLQAFMFMIFGFTFMDRFLMPAEVIIVIDVYGGCFCIPLEHGRDWTVGVSFSSCLSYADIHNQLRDLTGRFFTGLGLSLSSVKH